VPARLGGPGHSVGEMAAAVTALAHHCGSSALILAMHGIQVAMVCEHADPGAQRAIADRLLRGELLLANANSETGLGGDRRRSICALEPAGERLRLVKEAATVSYGEYADGILATARRAPDSPPSDQVLAICLPPDLTAEPSGEWDTLGMRGTCSRPCRISATLDPEFVIDDYATVFVQTSLPVSNLLLSSVWLGLGEAAARRAHQAVRAQARRLRSSDPEAGPPPSALRLAELGVVLHQLRAVLADGIRRYEEADAAGAATLQASGAIDNVKLASSTLVGDITQRAMAICGMAGFANRSPVSMGRIARDAAAAPLMVNNDRALTATAQSLLVRKHM
jgi:acyl-CoA dehydrogenase